MPGITVVLAIQNPTKHALFGINVVDLATGASLYAENADKLLQPASNAKLFTTTTTLALVGPEYKFLTTVEADTHPDKLGRIAGDVINGRRTDKPPAGRIKRPSDAIKRCARRSPRYPPTAARGKRIRIQRRGGRSRYVDAGALFEVIGDFDDLVFTEAPA